MEQAINAAVSAINGFLWDYIIIALLILSGFWFTYKTKFVQLRQIPEMLRLMKEGIGTSTEGNHISSFQAFCVSTASRVGVGNIAGVTIAIVLGGPGAVFWMWFIALLGSATGFIESTLAQIYKQPLVGGGYHGGPAYYMRHGLKSPLMATIFAVLISVTYGLIYNSVQANTIAASLNTYGMTTQVTGIIVAALTALVIFGGMSRIAKVSEVLVPIMAGLYILTAIVVIIMNIDKFFGVIGLIFSSVFDPTAAGGGFMGAAMMNGIKRGLFSNEAGEGSVPNAAATAVATHPVKQGLIQAFGVFVDTMLVCTASAFIILLSGHYDEGKLTGIALMQHDLGYVLGSWAPIALTIFVFMFAFSSIVGNYYYGEINIPMISKNKMHLNLFRILVIVMVYVGSVASLDFVWNLADLFMALMILSNLTAIVRLGDISIIALKDYIAQKKAGIMEPEFDDSILPVKDGVVCWKAEDKEARRQGLL